MSASEQVAVWELRERRSGLLLVSSTDPEKIDAEYQRRLRRAHRHLNKPGLHGGVRADEYIDLMIVRAL